MKWTRANLEEYAKSKGYEPLQEDGIPEGFSWKEPDVTISRWVDTGMVAVAHKGRIIRFKPLTDEITYGE